MTMSLLLGSDELPPARMTREEVAESQRARMLRAMAEAVAENGYANTVVADVTARARVSRKTFYEHFDGKEGCFLATFDECVKVLRAAVDDALDPELSLAEQVHAMLSAYIAVLTDEPKIAKTNLVEVYAAGPKAARRRRAALEGFAAIVKALHTRARAEGRGGRELTDTNYEFTVGAISTAITIRVATDDIVSLPGLVSELTDFVLRTMEA